TPSWSYRWSEPAGGAAASFCVKVNRKLNVVCPKAFVDCTLVTDLTCGPLTVPGVTDDVRGLAAPNSSVRLPLPELAPVTAPGLTIDPPSFSSVPTGSPTAARWQLPRRRT